MKAVAVDEIKKILAKYIQKEIQKRDHACLLSLDLKLCSQEKLEDFKKKIVKISAIELQFTTGPPAFPNGGRGSGGSPIHQLS